MPGISLRHMVDMVPTCIQLHNMYTIRRDKVDKK